MPSLTTQIASDTKGVKPGYRCWQREFPSSQPRTTLDRETASAQFHSGYIPLPVQFIMASSSQI